MDFSLTEEQLEVEKLARQILEDQATNEHLREIDQQEDRFDEKMWCDLAEAGLLGVAISEESGGMGLGFESLCLLIEAVGYTVAPLPVIPVLVSASLPIDAFGTDAQKSQWLTGVAGGTKILSAALIEANNEDVTAPETVAKRSGDGWVLEGTKSCVPFAHRAERVLVAAQLEAGVAAFLVDPRADGVTLNRQEVTAGEPQFEMVLHEAHVDAADLLAGPEHGAEVMRWTAERTTAAICAMAVGVCDRATRMTAAYTAEREQFGVKIATFQAVGQRAADCYIDTECLRLVTQQAVSLLNSDSPASEAVMMAKIWTGDVTHRVSHAAQHLHGGIGVDRDYPLFRYCLWAKQLELTLGSSAELLARLGEGIAREFTA